MSKIEKVEAYKLVKEYVTPEVWETQQRIIELWEYSAVKENNRNWRDNTLYVYGNTLIQRVIEFYEDFYETKGDIKWYIKILNQLVKYNDKL